MVHLKMKAEETRRRWRRRSRKREEKEKGWRERSGKVYIK